MTEVIRDFIYLDQERVRSFSAQLLQGVPESASSESGHEIGGRATAEAGLLKFLRAQGELDYRYRRTGTETRSLHHHVYTLFEQELDESRYLRLVDILFDHDSWSAGTFADGEFVKIRGTVQMIDHSRILARFQALPRFVKALQGIESARRTAQPPRQKSQTQSLASVASEFKKLPFDQLTSVGEQFYDASEFRLKVRPEGAPDDHIFVGQCQHASLFDASIMVGGMHRSPKGATWIVVGQIVAAQGAGEDADLMPTGNPLEDGLETMAEVLGG